MSRLSRCRAFLNLLVDENVEDDEDATPGISATSVS